MLRRNGACYSLTRKEHTTACRICQALSQKKDFCRFSPKKRGAFFAFFSYRRAPLLAWGLLLFLCCDTVVGLQVLRSYLAVPAPIVSLLSPGFDLVWAFYTPSQALLALSATQKAKS